MVSVGGSGIAGGRPCECARAFTNGESLILNAINRGQKGGSRRTYSSSSVHLPARRERESGGLGASGCQCAHDYSARVDSRYWKGCRRIRRGCTAR